MKCISTEALLFLFFFSIYAFTMSGRIQFGDEIEKYRVAQSILERGDFSFRPTVMRNQVGVDGRTYSIYELGQTILGVPLYALGRAVVSFFPQPDGNGITILFVGFLNPLITALTCVVLFWTALALGFHYRTALTLTVVFGLATVAWAYSKGYTREPLLGLCILLTFLAALRFAQTHQAHWLIASGVAAGYLVFSKFIQAMVLPFFVLYILAAILESHKRAGANARQWMTQASRALVLFALPGIILLGMQILYGFLRFGTLYGGVAGTSGGVAEVVQSELSQSNWLNALFGLFFSADKSVFLYSPPAILFLLAWFVFLRQRAKEAWLFLAIILVTFASTVTRGDWGGGSYWGPRYLEQITALLILPIGALLESPRAALKRFSQIALAILFGAGVFVQSIGVFTNDREILDMTGARTFLAGALDYLRHGALDSLVLALAPTGFPLQINPYGAILAAFAALAALSIFLRWRAGAESPTISLLNSVMFVSAALALVLAASVAFIAAPYPQIVAARGNTRFVAGKQFDRDGRACEARAMYLLAIENDTAYRRDALARLDELAPRVKGDPYSAEDLMAEVNQPANAQIQRDDANSLLGNGALMIRVPPDQDAIATAASVAADVLPNTAYEISGWIKTEGVYGGGTAVVTLYEDNGAWGKSRAFDVVSLAETNSWRPFGFTFVTLPTTKRLIIQTSLWKTYGTVWVDGIELGQTPKEKPNSTDQTYCPPY